MKAGKQQIPAYIRGSRMCCKHYRGFHSRRRISSRCGRSSNCNCCSAGSERGSCDYTVKKERFKKKKDFRINGQCKWFLKVGLPLAYVMSIQPHASLTKIGLVAPVATCFGIVLNVIFYLIFTRKMEWERKNKKLL